MKKILTTIILIIIANTVNMKALGPIDIGFYVGLSTPNDEFNNVFNKDNITFADSTKSTGEILRDATNSGYHFAMKVRFDLSEDFNLITGVGFHRFPESALTLDNPTNEDSYSFKTVQNVVPFSLGINYYLINSSVFGFYLNTDATYNYVVTTTDYVLSEDAPSLPLELLGGFNNGQKADTKGTLGFSFGGGIDFDLQLILLNIDIKFNMLNLVGKDDGEQAKNYFSLGLGFYF